MKKLLIALGYAGVVALAISAYLSIIGRLSEIEERMLQGYSDQNARIDETLETLERIRGRLNTQIVRLWKDSNKHRGNIKALAAIVDLDEKPKRQPEDLEEASKSSISDTKRAEWVENSNAELIPRGVFPFETGDSYSEAQLKQMFNKNMNRAANWVVDAFCAGIQAIEEKEGRRLTEEECDYLYEQIAPNRDGILTALQMHYTVLGDVLSEMIRDESYLLWDETRPGAFRSPPEKQEHFRITISTPPKGRPMTFDIPREAYPDLKNPSEYEKEIQTIITAKLSKLRRQP